MADSSVDQQALSRKKGKARAKKIAAEPEVVPELVLEEAPPFTCAPEALPPPRPEEKTVLQEQEPIFVLPQPYREDAIEQFYREEATLQHQRHELRLDEEKEKKAFLEWVLLISGTLSMSGYVVSKLFF